MDDPFQLGLAAGLILERMTITQTASGNKVPSAIAISGTRSPARLVRKNLESNGEILQLVERERPLLAQSGRSYANGMSRKLSGSHFVRR